MSGAPPGPNFGYVAESLTEDTIDAEPGYVDVGDVQYIPTTIEDSYEFMNTLPDFGTSPSGRILSRYIRSEGFGDHHNEVYDNWTKNTAEKTIYSRILTFRDGNVVCFENFIRLPPRYSRDGKILTLTPKMAREQGVTYSSDWHIDVVLRRGGYDGPEIDRASSICIGSIPLTLGSEGCVLHGKSPRERALLGEDPDDPLGMLIIAGVEKVVLFQEQLVLNKILLMNIDTKGSTVARLTVSTQRGTSLIELALDKKTRKMIKIRFPSMRSKSGDKYKSINVLRVFRYLFRTVFHLPEADDVTQIQNLIMLFVQPDRVKKSTLKLISNLMEFMAITDDVDIMAAKMDKSNATRDEKLAAINRVLESDLFPHLNNLPGPDNETMVDHNVRITKAKVQLLAIMVARFLEHLAGYRGLDDRDSWSNKRIEGAGRMMEALFRNAWRRTLGIIQGHIEANSIKNIQGVVEKLRHSIITDTFHDSFISSNWGVKGSQMKNNVAQTLVRDSVTATYAHMNTIDVSISRTDRQHSLRMVQNSQWGFVDPCSTPEGENCGLLKNLGITAKVSIERSDTDIIRHLIGDRGMGWVQRVSSNESDREPNRWFDKIIVNGKFLGWCNGEETREYLISLRRRDQLPMDMGVIKEDDWVYVDISPSRPIRPLLIVDDDQQLAIDRLNMREAPIRRILTSGAMEYIASWEQEYIKIAARQEDIDKRLKTIRNAVQTHQEAVGHLTTITESGGIAADVMVGGEVVNMTLEEATERLTSAAEALKKLENNRPYTHCELDPMAILSVAAALIPWPNHNQAPRNTYQVSMGKQALGNYHSNHHNRFDGKTKVLAFPDRPALETLMNSTIGLDKKPQGEMANIGFMAFPFTEEDSFIVKKEFLDNGGFRMYKYLTYKTIVKNPGEITEQLTLPAARPGEPPERYKYIQMYEKGNPNNGLPMIGAPLTQGMCVIGKEQYVQKSKEVRNESVILRVGDEGVVDKVLVTSDNKTVVVIVKLRTMRVPQEGDKFAPRNAQKGTIGLVVSDIDLPADLQGITPDFLINVHCFTSDTPVLMKNGLARPLTSMRYNGGDKVWSLDPNLYKFVRDESVGYGFSGVKDIVKLTLSDGRTIRCTPDHKFPVIESKGSFMINRKVPANEITSNMHLVATIDGVVDAPTPEERAHELNWSLTAGDYTFNMNTMENRDKALAFARLVGMICTDGYIGHGGDSIIGGIVTGCLIDVDVILDDIQLLTGKRPKASSHQSEIGGNTYSFRLPQPFARAVGSLHGMTIGRRTTQVPEWPTFVFQEHCPKSIIREFLAGAFGGDGWSPYLKTNKQDGQGTVTFNPPAISQSSIPEQADELVEKMEDLTRLLERVGVYGARTDKPKGYVTYNGKEMIRCNLQLPRGTEFGDKVGFRYCVQKQYRMAAYQSYMRYLSNVKRQNDFVVQRTSEIYDSGVVGRSMQKALDAARKELHAHENPLNEYYSNATLDQVRNRRRKDRFDELMNWDYSKIEDADVYLRKIGVYHWFRTAEGTGGAEYILHREANDMPGYYLTLNDIRPMGKEEVFDLGIRETHMLTVNGTSACNSMPSRMTMEYPMELIASKYAALKGVYVNGGAFEPFELNMYRQTLRDYGRDEFGYETMRSGLSGKLIPTPIYSGPVFFQALKHHVKDKVQARNTGQVKPMTRQPPRGRGNKGGLRFGEMERDAAISHGASAFLLERLMKVSDAYQTAFCRVCGTFAVNSTQGYRPCRLCGNSDKYGRCTIPYVYKLLTHLLGAPGIFLRPEFVTTEEYAEKLFRRGVSTMGTDIGDIQLTDADEGLEEEDQEINNLEPETGYDDIYD